MSRAIPLTWDEVPDDSKEFFDYNTQYQESYRVKDRTRMRTMVWALCEVCKEYNGVPVNDVRNWIRGVRAARPGTHRACKYPGKYTTQEGYVWRWMPEHPNAMGKKYVAEHIYVMSEFLGRPLDTEAESVHHINGNKSDNRLENLQLRNRYHGKGVALECLDCGGHNIAAVALKDVPCTCGSIDDFVNNNLHHFADCPRFTTA